MSIASDNTSIMPYTPTDPHLDLTSTQFTQSVLNSISPLNYNLTVGDFMLHQFTNTSAYTLSPSVGTSLWWSLQQLALRIMDGGYYPYEEPTPPPAYAEPPTDHDNQDQIVVVDQTPSPFARLARFLPSIIDITLSNSGFNPVFCLGTHDQLYELHQNLQEVGRQAIEWIAAVEQARVRDASNASRIAGDASNLDQVTRSFGQLRIEYPTRFLITNGTQSTLHASTTIKSNHLTKNSRLPDTSREMILHPTHSLYARSHPDYDAFSRSTLIDNGFINTDTRMVIHGQRPHVCGPPPIRSIPSASSLSANAVAGPSSIPSIPSRSARRRFRSRGTNTRTRAVRAARARADVEMIDLTGDAN